MPVMLSSSSAIIRHDNHTAPGSFTVRTLSPNGADFLIIRNTDSTNNAQISFDGSQGFSIRPGEIFTFELINQRTYYTKATAGSPALEVMIGSDQ